MVNGVHVSVKYVLRKAIVLSNVLHTHSVLNWIIHLSVNLTLVLVDPLNTERTTDECQQNVIFTSNQVEYNSET